jgi:hypothetical protein
MSQWRERAEEMLYAGESVEETFEVDDARILVTGHRVLAFTPGADGATFQQADRPNVAGVSSGARAESGLLERGVRMGVIGVVLAVLRNLHHYMQLVGALCLLLAVALLGVYWHLREPTLVIEAEGDEDIRVTRPTGGTEAVVDRLDRAIAPGTDGGGAEERRAGGRRGQTY